MRYVAPGLRELALFYEDYLKETDKNGDYIFVPSYSPESYPRNSERSPAVIKATMDISICREVLTRVIEASQVLGINSEEIPRWKAMLAKLPPTFGYRWCTQGVGLADPGRESGSSARLSSLWRVAWG
jgi:hypothetical protein